MVYTLLCPISYTQMFCQVKNLKKIHNQGKPNHYSTCSCQVKNGQYFVNRFSIHEMALSERILGRYSHKCCQIHGNFQRNVRKCWFLFSIDFYPIKMHLSCSIEAVIPFLLQHACKTKTLHLRVCKKLVNGAIWQ